jgi:phospholipid-translocating ATPase
MGVVRPAVDTDSDTETDIMDESRIDPDLRLRTVRTAASAIAESIRSEARMEKRRRLRNGLRRTLRGKGKGTWKISLKKREGVVSGVSEGEGSVVMATTAASVVGGGDGERPFSMTTNASAPSTGTGKDTGSSKVPVGRRRNIYVNLPLPANELNASGEPIVHYTRNKVRTTSKSLFFPIYYIFSFRNPFVLPPSLLPFYLTT